MIFLKNTNTRIKEQALQNIQRVSEHADKLLSTNDILEACLYLDAELSAKNIKSYTVISAENQCYKPERMSKLPPFEQNGKASIYKFDDTSLVIKRMRTGQIDWAISILEPKDLNAIEMLKSYPEIRIGFLQDLLIVIYIVFAFILCAVLIFAESIQNKYKLNGKDPTWLKVLNEDF